MKDQIANMLALTQVMEGLKRELRHSHLSDGRVESVAEHSWRLAFMVLAIAPSIAHEFDVAKALKMAIVHDIAEVYATDIPLFQTDNDARARAEKMEKETAAMATIRSIAGEPLGEWLVNCWHEYEAQACFESRVVRALDKLEAQIQHNQASLDTWNDWEKARLFSGSLEDSSAVCEATAQLCEMVLEQGRRKL